MLLAETAPSLPDQTGHVGEFLQTDGTETSWAAAGGGGQPVTFQIQHSGDNDNYPLYVRGDESQVEGDDHLTCSASGIVVNLGAGGTIKLVRKAHAGETTVATLGYTELIVARVGGTDRIIANPATGVVPIPNGSSSPQWEQAVPLTSDWDAAGSDLSVSGGSVVTAAGGDFLVTLNMYVTLS